MTEDERTPADSEAGLSSPIVERRSTIRVLLRGTSWNALGQFVPVVINIVMTPYVIHHLGVERWGLIALVTTLQTILGSFDGGLTESTTRYFAVYAGTDDRAQTTRLLVTVLSVIFVGGVVVGSVGWVLAPPVVDLFSMPDSLRPETVFYLRSVVALIALIFARNSITAVLIARQRYALISLRSLGTYAIWIGGLVLTVNEGWGLRGVAATFLAQQFADTLVITPQALKYLDRSSVGFLRRSEARRLFTYSGQVQISGLARLANAEIPSLVIGTAISVHALAMYSTGMGLATQVSSIFGNAAGPAGVHLGRTFGAEGDPGARRAFARLQKIWVIACNGAYAVGIGGAYYAIVDWLGHSFSLAGVIATIMVAGQGVLTLGSIFALYCVTVGRADIGMRLGIVSVCVTVVLTAGLVFVGVLGVVAASVTAWLAACWYLVRDARSKISADLPHFAEDLSFGATTITIAIVFGLEYLLHPYVPVGPIGLLLAGGPCLVGLAVFFVIRLRPRVYIAAWSQAIQSRADGPLIVIKRMVSEVGAAITSDVVQKKSGR